MVTISLQISFVRTTANCKTKYFVLQYKTIAEKSGLTIRRQTNDVDAFSAMRSRDLVVLEHSTLSYASACVSLVKAAVVNLVL